jgi:hypothetical protein
MLDEGDDEASDSRFDGRGTPQEKFYWRPVAPTLTGQKCPCSPARAFCIGAPILAITSSVQRNVRRRELLWEMATGFELNALSGLPGTRQATE